MHGERSLVANVKIFICLRCDPQILVSEAYPLC